MSTVQQIIDRHGSLISRSVIAKEMNRMVTIRNWNHLAVCSMLCSMMLSAFADGQLKMLIEMAAATFACGALAITTTYIVDGASNKTVWLVSNLQIKATVMSSLLLGFGPLLYWFVDLSSAVLVVGMCWCPMGFLWLCNREPRGAAASIFRSKQKTAVRQKTAVSWKEIFQNGK